MRKTIGFGLLAAAALLTPALADSFDKKLEGAAPTQSVAAKVEQMGYDLQSGREHDDRYHANLLDRETGKMVHAEFRIADGELMSARLHAKDGERHDKNGERSDDDRREDHRTAGDRN